ncbi:flagellar hook-length control protein FliK [Microbulbifer thermotolerans]|uniref:flagellar hook-length control protein FliK n=1 Tax=Microbulbifer thermotolerans TaxID=252514 RepID=UPI00224AC304|nr:flagellar hook-length control protein FliK [Microbulbifer thermotolerans]MCX2780119.1 flagellar hook-length control protein FliK [Microbulbifer thermotolerans]MCX2805543.1 flagellar hook-length control protein FliK [Microbulbifer thermotolerans]
MDITALLTALSTNTDKSLANITSGEDGDSFAQALAVAAREPEGVSAELLTEILPAPAREKFTALTLNSSTTSATQATDAETVAQEVAGDETLASALAAAFAVSATAAPGVNTDSTGTGDASASPIAGSLQPGQDPLADAATRKAATQFPAPAVQADSAATMAATDAATQITKASPVKVNVDTAQERPVSAVLTSSESAVSGLTSAADLGHVTQPAAASASTTNAPAAAQVGPTSAPLTLQSPLASDAWGRELEQQLVGIAQRGDKTVELQLNPRELGPLSVNLTLDDQGAKVQFLAAQAAVRTAVEQAIPQLRDALAQQGIALGEATVGEQQQNQQQSAERGYQDGNFGSGESAPEIASAPADIKLPTGRNGGVDLYA